MEDLALRIEQERKIHRLEECVAAARQFLKTDHEDFSLHPVSVQHVFQTLHPLVRIFPICIVQSFQNMLEVT